MCALVHNNVLSNEGADANRQAPHISTRHYDNEPHASISSTVAVIRPLQTSPGVKPLNTPDTKIRFGFFRTVFLPCDRISSYLDPCYDFWKKVR
jgi:hypothetical protein